MTQYTWLDAVDAWRAENPQRTEKWKRDEARLLAWLNVKLGRIELPSINRAKVETLRSALLLYGYAPKTVNHHLAVLRAVLRAAVDREWISTMPRVRLLRIVWRVRWLTAAEARAVLRELPPHLKAMAEFTLETGLRKNNVAGLAWSQINLARAEVTMPADAMKNRAALTLPLSDRALEIVRAQIGQHPQTVFTWRGAGIKEPGGPAWRKALKRAGIGNFHWHDLRHTWASWHAQDGVPDRALQELGGWKSQVMVHRYTHLNVAHLRQWVNKRPALSAYN